MQNAKIGRSIDKSLGLKHAGTINLNAGTTFSQEQLRKDPAQVIAGIVRQQRALWSKSINDWIRARALALNPLYPQRGLLYSVYDDIMLDNFIHGQIYNHRITPIKNKPFKITDAAGKPKDELTDLLKKKWLKSYIKFGLESIFFGHSLPYIDKLEVKGSTAFIKNLKLVPREHVHPEQHFIASFESDMQGVDYTSDPICNYYFSIGDDDDLGLLNKAAPLAILKKHAWTNWNEFAERFGIPIIVAKTQSQDPRVQDEIEEWLQELSTGAYGIFPLDTEFEIKENNKADAFQVFKEMLSAANEELAILFSGQAMTSMNGSSRAQGEVHERVKSEITKDDESFIETLINEQLIPLLRDIHGYPFADGDKFVWDEPKDLTARLAIFKGVNDMGFQLDAKQVEEELGVKIAGIKAAPVAPGDPKDKEEQDDESGKPDEEEAKKKKPAGKAKKKTEKDKELSAINHLVKLHARINELHGGVNVH